MTSSDQGSPNTSSAKCTGQSDLRCRRLISLALLVLAIHKYYSMDLPKASTTTDASDRSERAIRLRARAEPRMIVRHDARRPRVRWRRDAYERIPPARPRGKLARVRGRR